jgi:hypothetical protein
VPRSWTLIVAVVALATSEPARAATLRFIYWQPSGVTEPAAGVRRALELEARAHGAVVLDVTPAATVAVSLAEELAAAIAADRAFRFAEAEQRLDALARRADVEGGGDLDARQLSDLYLHRGLARSERNDPEAWNDFVRAARLDTTRVLDPSQFPPRVVATYRRAVDEALALPAAEVELRPADVPLRIDGRDARGHVSLPLGPHLVRSDGGGFAPWAGRIDVASRRQTVDLPLQPLRPPSPSQLRQQPQDTMAAVVERTAGGWQITVHSLLSDARPLSAAIDGGSAESTTRRLVQQLLPMPPGPSREPPPPRSRRLLPWWGWTLVGVAVTAAVVVPVTVVYASPSGVGIAGGSIGPLR